MEHQNYCTAENGVRICNVSSTLPNCAAENILIPQRQALWMSLAGLPQSITLDLSQVQERPKFIKCFGFDCWHDYQSNPSVIELMVSLNGENYITWTTLYPELKQGIQLFQIDPLGTRYQFIKIIIKETFGASKTYLNQIFLLEEYAMITTESVTESQQQTENNNSQFKQHFDKEDVDHHERSDRIDRFEKVERQDRNDRQDIKMNEYQELAQKIQSMGREVASLKQSHQQGKSSQSQTKQGFHKSNIVEDVPESFQRLTSTERMVIDIQTKNQGEINILRKEVQDWKDKCESLESQVQKLIKVVTQIKDRQQDQEEQLQRYIQQNQSEISFDASKKQVYNNNLQNNQSSQSKQQFQQQQQNQQQLQNQQQQQQQGNKIEEIIDKKISEMTGSFQQLLIQQESKFKNQQKDMVKSFKEYIQQEQQQEKQQQQQQRENRKSNSRGRQKERSQTKSSSPEKSSASSSSSSIINFIKSKKPLTKSKSRQNSKSQLKSQPRSRSPVEQKENDRFENNRLSPKQRKVATLLGKLQEKLQKRAKKIEQLNLSQRKTRKRSSIQNSIEQSNSSDY